MLAARIAFCRPGFRRHDRPRRYPRLSRQERAARGEFREELGIALLAPLLPLGEIRQRGGKIVAAFAVEHDVDVTAVQSNRFEIEWPPHSGKRQSFPEIDRAGWFDVATAHSKINVAQKALLDRLEAMHEPYPEP